MSDAFAADPSTADATQSALPRVVVIVRPLSAAAAAASATAVARGVDLPSTDEIPTDRVKREDLARDAEPADAQAADDADAGTQKFVAAEVEDDKPTARYHLDGKRPHAPEDDVLQAVVIQLDPNADPNPLDSFLGPSLLERAGRAAEEAQAPRLVLVAPKLDPEWRERAVTAAQRGFRTGVVEIYSEDPSYADLGRGRLLLLDGSALHDGRALAQLARVKGDKVALLLTQRGDGPLVRAEDGKVMEIGEDVQPNDGALAGACSCPGDEFDDLSQRGLMSQINRLSSDERLIARVAPDSHARMFRDGARSENAQRFCYDALAGSKNDGLVEQFFGKPLSRILTLLLLPRLSISPGHVLALAGVFGFAAAALLSLGAPHFAALAGVLLVISAILDRCDGELARLRLDDRPRPLDFLLDHAILASVFLGLAWGIDRDLPDVANWQTTVDLLPAVMREVLNPVAAKALLLGAVGAAGVVLMLAISSWRGPPHPQARGMERLGDLVASSFGSRDYAYLVLLAGAIHAVVPGLGVLGLLLLVCVAGIWGFSALLLAAQVLSPRRKPE